MLNDEEQRSSSIKRSNTGSDRQTDLLMTQRLRDAKETHTKQGPHEKKGRGLTTGRERKRRAARRLD